jgi:hypothetical protein
MATDVDICNMALGLLGVENIASLSDTSKAAKVCTTFYEKTKFHLLRSHNWNFAMERAYLTSSGTPLFEFKYKITKPNHYLRIVSFYDYTGEFKEEGNYILLNQSSVKAKYIVDDIDEEDFDASFVIALASKLAETMCFQMTQNSAREQLLSVRHKNDIAEAKRNNAISNTPDAFQQDTWLAARL